MTSFVPQICGDWITSHAVDYRDIDASKNYESEVARKDEISFRDIWKQKPRSARDQKRKVQNIFSSDKFHNNGQNHKRDRVEDTKHCGVKKNSAFYWIVAGWKLRKQF